MRLSSTFAQLTNIPKLTASLVSNIHKLTISLVLSVNNYQVKQKLFL